MTPPRTSGSRNRYPDLGRVPLHRRGTSKHYERLEDLLKEAGYKETRIFTPETQRVEQNDGRDTLGNDENRLSVVKDAVVGFLSGFMPGGSGNKQPSLNNPSLGEFTSSPQDYLPPTSPLYSRQTQRSPTMLETESTTPDVPPSAMTSSFSSFGDPLSGSQEFGYPAVVVQSSTPFQSPRQEPYSQVPYSTNRLQTQSSRGSLSPTFSSTTVVSPRPSRATAYLRHMASAPNIPQRPSSTPATGHNRSQYSLNDSDYDSPSEGVPPLPSTWLKNVARVVMLGGSNLHIGGPLSSSSTEIGAPSIGTTPTSSTITRPVLRPSRSSLSQTSRYVRRPPAMSRFGFSDPANMRASSSRHHGPPSRPPSALFRGRSSHLDSEVSLTKVVCRSAPGSRASSLNRDSMIANKRTKERERGRNGQKKESGEKHLFRVPSLARTQVEGDMWSLAEGSKQRRASKSHLENRGDFSSRKRDEGQGRKHFESSAHLSASDEDLDEEESEDEIEINLAQMLLPPKRQNSIRSLRKHLASETQGGERDAHMSLTRALGAGSGDGRYRSRSSVGRVGDLGKKKSRQYDVGITKRSESDDEPGSESLARWRTRNGGVRERNRGSDDEDVEAFAGFFGVGGERLGSGRSRTGKNRLGINGGWGFIGGGS